MASLTCSFPRARSLDNPRLRPEGPKQPARTAKARRDVLGRAPQLLIVDFGRGRGAALADFNRLVMLEPSRSTGGAAGAETLAERRFRRCGNTGPDGCLARTPGHAARPQPRRDQRNEEVRSVKETRCATGPFGGWPLQRWLGWVHGASVRQRGRCASPVAGLARSTGISRHRQRVSRDRARRQPGAVVAAARQLSGGVEPMRKARLARIELPDFGMPDASPERPDAVYSTRIALRERPRNPRVATASPLHADRGTARNSLPTWD